MFSDKGTQRHKWELLSEAECLGLQESSRIPSDHNHRSSAFPAETLLLLSPLGCPQLHHFLCLLWPFGEIKSEAQRGGKIWGHQGNKN